MGGTLDRYELIDAVGAGAFATVWRAHDPVIDETVAIKVLADNWARHDEVRERFVTEAKLALRLTNDRLIRVHHVAESSDTNTPYIVMAFADGGTLQQRIIDRRLQPHSINEALEILRDTALAIAALHDNGLLHRDLKPANILYQSTPAGIERLVLADFGLVRAIDRSALTMVSGSPAYAAPEQAAGITQLNEQADLYPLGIIFLELITGEIPTANDSMKDTATTHVDIDAALTAGEIVIDEPTRNLLDTLLDPQPDNRPPSAQNVANQISQLLHNDAPPDPTTKTAPSDTPLLPTRSPSRNKVPLIGAAIVGLLSVIIGLAVVLTGNDTDPELTTTSTTTDAQSDSIAPTPEPATGPDASETQTPAEFTAIEAAAEIPEDFPTPNGIVKQNAASNGTKQHTYTLASTPQNVIAFYETGEWESTARSEQGDLTRLELTNGTNIVTAEIQPINNTSGVELVRLTITAVN